MKINKSKKLTNYIKVKKLDAQSLLNLLKKKLYNLVIIDKKKSILTENEFVLFPLVENETIIRKFFENIKSKLHFDVISREGYFTSSDHSQSLHNILKEKLPQNIYNLIPKSFDIIGKIAIVEFPQFKDLNLYDAKKYKKVFAYSLTKFNHSIKSVYEKKSKIKGKYRLRELKLLYGKKSSETFHKENHCIFKLDIKKVYFSPRLVYERKRLSNYSLKEDEIIVDMFAGIGPISIQLAKKYKVRIYSFDINPSAYVYLKENILLNNLIGQVFPYNLDVNDLIKVKNQLGAQLKGKVDRIIMNLPEKSKNYIDIACFLLNSSGGILHYYQFSESNKAIDNTIDTLSLALKKNKWCIERIINSKVVKAYSPKVDLVVIDCMINPKSENNFN